jgi:hypothetical protein
MFSLHQGETMKKIATVVLLLILTTAQNIKCQISVSSTLRVWLVSYIDWQ